MKRNRTTMMAVALAAYASAYGQSATDKLDSTISAALAASGAPSVSVAVVQNGKISYAKAFGKADIEANRAADTSTRYAVGSISKQFTAAALLLLEEQHKLSLDDKVGKYFPGLTRAKEITIRQLLSHTSGYEDFAPQDYLIPEWTKPTTSTAILDHWAKAPLNFDPGTRWQYSNTGYVLAAAIFEKVQGQPLVDFLQEKIFEPLGMASAGDCSTRTPNDAKPYTRFALGPPRPVGREASGWYNGAGELCMTPSDLAKWDIAFFEKRILSPQSYTEFTQEIRLTDGKSTHYGLGLTIGDVNGIPELSHGGEVSGFLAVDRMYPSKGVAVIACSNEDGIHLVNGLSAKIARLLLEPSAKEASETELADVREILEGLAAGRIDRSRFSANANSYFNDAALADYRESLSKLGKLMGVTRQSESLRGGMIHRSYRAQFERKTVTLNVYVLTNGKYEQFLVMEDV